MYTSQSSESSAHEVKGQGHLVYRLGRVPRRRSRYPYGRREATSEEDIEPTTQWQRLSQQPPVSTQVPQGPHLDRVVQQPLQQEQAIRRSLPTAARVLVS